MNARLAGKTVPVACFDESLDDLVEEVRHLLPCQAPIRRFVHHNTLHHFEALEFEDAVLEGARIFDCEPYPTEEFFSKARESGRIADRDLEAALAEESARLPSVDPILPFQSWSRSRFRSFRLGHVIVWPNESEVAFRVAEGTALREFWPTVSEEGRQAFLAGQESKEHALSLLWTRLGTVCPNRSKAAESRTEELESLVHSLLIRFCGAYLDQGVCYWPMPSRNGLWEAFAELYSQPSLATLPWLAGLAARLEQYERRGASSQEVLLEALGVLAPRPDDWPAELARRGLALRGWAGMVSQMETRPDLAPVEAPPVRLVDYLAIYLLLEIQARQYLEIGLGPRRAQQAPDLQLAYEAFVLAQLAGLGPAALDSQDKLQSWLAEVQDFGPLKRRKLLFWAYERRYRLEILDGISQHCQLGEYRSELLPKFQAVFCIDDREESLRRHLEEIEPRVETLGMAGFFGVRMVYQGWNEVSGLPLCPANATAKHLVREVDLKGDRAASNAMGTVQQSLRAGRNGVFSGGLLATTAGFLAGFSLVGRTLAPGLFSQLDHRFEHAFSQPPQTRLAIERAEEAVPNGEGLWEGFTVSEMTDIVKGALTSMGVTKFANLFLFVGHGSSSLNNPHEAAHDCGATGGGRGGPNARAFAAMANHPEVRKRLEEQAVRIPAETWFVGGYHNTCDDSMEYYDLDLVPKALSEELSAMLEAIEKACVMDAHERCRRFKDVLPSASPSQAYRHVQARAVTLAQPRPEYGHCTNSICVVGRRERTRGLFLDRRAFLVSYDPTLDADGSTLGGLLESVGPVGAGINLEYYFSSIDCAGYGCGTKLPHNITGLLGVMDGHSSDLRTGLPWQMVEIHEPMRLLVIVEAMPELLNHLMQCSAGVRGLVEKGWIQLVAWSPSSADLWTYRDGEWRAHSRDSLDFPVKESSRDYYSGHRQHLPPARIQAAFGVNS